MKLLITGAKGFLGKNLVWFLRQNKEYTILEYDVDNRDELFSYLPEADWIFHLAGVNRPKNVEDYKVGNFELTETITNQLQKLNKKTSIVFSSSTQASLNNPYGESKKKAEDVLRKYHEKTKAPVYIFRFPNLFGKWSKPNYNSFVATLCHNISRGKEIFIDDRNKILELVYADDAVKDLADLLINPSKVGVDGFCQISNITKISLGFLEEKLLQFKNSRETLLLPDFSDDFTKKLYATYISNLALDNFSYLLKQNQDERGWLVELLKSKHAGQIFVSTTKPGITRGNHFHHSKIEKFCVIKGEGVIKFRAIDQDEVISYKVSADKITVVDIPPGYTHSIENLSKNEEMIVIFWANEIFSQDYPDTYFMKVENEN